MFGLDSETKRPVVIGAALLAIALAGWAIFSTLHSPRSGLDKKAFKGLGEAVAQAASQAVGDHGQIVLVTYFVNQSGTPSAEWLNTQLDGFMNALRAHPGVVIAATERVELGLSPDEAAAKGMDTAASYFALATKYPNAGAIVLLTDVPNLGPDDLSRLPKPLPKIIAVSNSAGIPNLRRLFEAGVLQAAILPRWEPLADAAQPHTPAEWFARNFLVVTPTNINVLPNPSAVN